MLTTFLYIWYEGRDRQSWGLSYLGNVHHMGRTQPFSEKIGQGAIVGVHLDMWHGTLSYYLNRKPLGVAYHGLRGKVLYPVVSSTAARSGMKVICTRSFPSTLQFLCCMMLRRYEIGNDWVANNVWDGRCQFLFSSCKRNVIEDN